MDTHQAVYDAVRSKISSCDTGHIVDRAARQALSLGMVPAILEQEIYSVSNQMTMPHVLMRPEVYPDGNQWCALYGKDLMMGVCGFGDTPQAACAAFDEAWFKQKLPTKEPAP